MKKDCVTITVRTAMGETIAEVTWSSTSKQEALRRLREMVKAVEAYAPPKKLKPKTKRKAKAKR